MTDKKGAFDPSSFAKEMGEDFHQRAQQMGDMFKGMNRQLAEAYRDLLDKQLEQDPFSRMEKDWSKKMMEVFLEQMRSQRQARSKFLEMQRSMLDRYMEMLDPDGCGEEAERGHEHGSKKG